MSEFSQIWNDFATWHSAHPLTSSGISAAIGGFVTWALSGLLKWWGYTRHRKAWRIALSEELKYLLEVVSDELIRDVSKAGYSLKRLNEDFLQDARLQGYTFDVRPEFLKRLAHAYRDVIHSNSVLDLALDNHKKSDYSTKPTALSSLQTVRGKLIALKEIVDKKLISWFNPCRYCRERP